MIEIREKKAGLPAPEFREEFSGFSVFFDKGKSGEVVLEQLNDWLGERLGETNEVKFEALVELSLVRN